MKAKRVVIGAVICTAQCLAIAWVMRAQQKPAAAPAKIYNTAKLKLMQGKPIFGVTIESPDPNIYCAAANSGYDFTWIEMQHSTLTYADAARMIWACRGAKATPRAGRDRKRYPEGHGYRGSGRNRSHCRHG